MESKTKIDKKILISIILALIIIIAIVIVIIVLINNKSSNKKENGNTPEDAIKGYISGYDKLDNDKILENYDAKGAVARSNSDGDIQEFKNLYDDVNNEDIKDFEEMIKYPIEEFKTYDSFSMNLEEIEEIEKIEDCEDLYEVKAKVSISMKEDKDKDESKSSKTVTFMVYKDKVISME